MNFKYFPVLDFPVCFPVARMIAGGESDTLPRRARLSGRG
jgi:hypothetical protein